MNKIKLLLLMSAAPVIIFFIIIVSVIGAGSSAAVPIEPVATEEKAEEYATIASKMCAPWEIVIIADAIEAQANKKDGIEDVNPIYTTLEFLFLDVEKYHYEVISSDYNEETDTWDDTWDWVYINTVRYTAKNQILEYIGIADNAVDDMDTDTLIQIAINAAENASNSEWSYYINFSTNSDFETVLRNYIGMEQDYIEQVLELYNSGYLETWFSEETLEKINDIKAMYGMYQFVDKNGNYNSYEGIAFQDGVIDVIYFNQLDTRWKDKPYGTDDIGGSGCGPTAMSIVISTLTGETYDPVYMAVWSYQNGYWCKGNGSYHSLIPNAAKAFGLTVSGCTAAEPQRIVDALAEGKLVVALMSKGHFTSGGHYIVLRGVTINGTILVADPASHDRSQQMWDLSIILNEARIGAGAGGPFWIIG